MNLLFNGQFFFTSVISDNHPDRFTKNCSIVAFGACGPKNRSLLGIWSSSASSANGHLCSNCPLVGLHLVRCYAHWKGISQLSSIIRNRYAIGNAERVMLTKNIGWLHTLGNDIDEPYYENKTGGPSIKVVSDHLPCTSFISLH